MRGNLWVGFSMTQMCRSRLAPGLAVVVILLVVACDALATSAPIAVPVTTAAATWVPTSTARTTDIPTPTKTQVLSPAVASTLAELQSTSAPEPTSTLAPRLTDVPATQEPQSNEESNSVDPSPSKDNTLYQTSANIASNGSGRHLFAGNTGAGSTRSALLAFDVEGATLAGSTVTGAASTLNMSKTQASVQEIGLHRLLSDWGEGESDVRSKEGEGIAAVAGDATWIHTFFDPGEWTNQGGGFVATDSSTQEIVGTGHHAWS